MAVAHAVGPPGARPGWDEQLPQDRQRRRPAQAHNTDSTFARRRSHCGDRIVVEHAGIIAWRLRLGRTAGRSPPTSIVTGTPLKTCPFYAIVMAHSRVCPRMYLCRLQPT